MDKIDKQEMILDYIKNNGPVIPIDISKFLKCDSLIASAMLSGLSSMNQLKVSKMKIGGSPLYYAPGQEEMLQKYSDKLGMGEKGTYNLLKSRRILVDKNLNQLQREALQRIKDFAIMLEVEIPGKGIKEIFWKWYMLSDNDTENMIKDALKDLYYPKKDKPKPLPEPIKEKAKELEIKETKDVKEIKDIKQARDEERKQEKEVVKIISAEEEKKDKSKKKDKQDKPKKEVKRKILKKKELDTKPEEEKKSTKFKIEEELLKIQEEEREAQKKDKPKTPAMIEKDEKVGVFMQIVQDYFKKNEILVVETEIIRPNEIDFVIKIPSPVGKIAYYCKAKDKRTVNEGDLSTAFVQGQLKKLPILFLSNGNLTKRAKEMQEKQFQHMNIAYLDEQE